MTCTTSIFSMQCVRVLCNIWIERQGRVLGFMLHCGYKALESFGPKIWKVHNVECTTKIWGIQFFAAVWRVNKCCFISFWTKYVLDFPIAHCENFRKCLLTMIHGPQLHSASLPVVRLLFESNPFKSYIEDYVTSVALDSSTSTSIAWKFL